MKYLFLILLSSNANAGFMTGLVVGHMMASGSCQSCQPSIDSARNECKSSIEAKDAKIVQLEKQNEELKWRKSGK